MTSHSKFRNLEVLRVQLFNKFIILQACRKTNVYTWSFLAFLPDFRILIYLEKIFSGNVQSSLEPNIVATTRKEQEWYFAMRAEIRKSRDLQVEGRRPGSREQVSQATRVRRLVSFRKRTPV